MTGRRAPPRPAVTGGRGRGGRGGHPHARIRGGSSASAHGGGASAGAARGGRLPSGTVSPSVAAVLSAPPTPPPLNPPLPPPHREWRCIGVAAAAVAATVTAFVAAAGIAARRRRRRGPRHQTRRVAGGSFIVGGWLAVPWCAIDLMQRRAFENDLSIQSITWRRAIGQLAPVWLDTVGSYYGHVHGSAPIDHDLE